MFLKCVTMFWLCFHSVLQKDHGTSSFVHIHSRYNVNTHLVCFKTKLNVNEKHRSNRNTQIIVYWPVITDVDLTSVALCWPCYSQLYLEDSIPHAWPQHP